MVVFLGFWSKLLGARDESRAPKGLLQKSKTTAVWKPQDHVASLSWFSAIIVRELNTFEIAERHRLSVIILGGFITTNPRETVEKKVEMILLGVIAHCLNQLSHYDGMRVDNEQQLKEKDKIKEETDMLRKNFTYLTELIMPIVLKVTCMPQPLDYKTVMDKYLSLGRELQKIEHLVVTPYNCEIKIDGHVHWDYDLKRHVKNTESSGGKGSQ